MLELILVMVIIALIAGMVAPALFKFSAGRALDNYSRQLVASAAYARTQSISEARVYRINFDEKAGQFWVTADNGDGTYVAASGSYGKRSAPPIGVRMTVQVTAQPNVLLPLNQNVQQESVQQPSTTLDGQSGGATGSIMTNVHVQGPQYVEFQPNGRIDPATIDLTDNAGRHVQVACATPTDRFAMVEGAQ